MELSQLNYFRVLARMQHVTRAALALGIAQSTLSRAMARLENEFGVALFAPSGRSVTLTAYGATYLAFVERALDELERGRARIAEVSRAGGTTLSLGFSRSLSSRLVPDLTRRFRVHHPETRFLLTEDNRDRLLALLRSGEIAFCISDRVGAPHVAWQPIAHQSFIVIVPPGHRLAERTHVAIADLAGEPLVALKETYQVRRRVDALFRAAGVTPLVVSESNDSAVLYGQVAAGAGIAIVPDSGEADNVVALKVDDALAGRDIGIAHVTDRPLSHLESAFLAFAIELSRSGH